MSQQITSQEFIPLSQALDQHPVYAAVDSLEALRVFMEHHVYAVWDFMSLLKFLQAAIAPAGTPWIPHGDPEVRRFINTLVLEEETDESYIDGAHTSHFELYLQAMREIGADTAPVEQFIAAVKQLGVNAALTDCNIPHAARAFTRSTFATIENNKPHEVAAVFAFGREHAVPLMFRSLLDRMGIGADEAPGFRYYLERHIHLDGELHGPLALRLVNSLCNGNEIRVQEAIIATRGAMKSRLRFWDAIHEQRADDAAEEVLQP